MMNFNVYYHPVTGEIDSYDNGSGLNPNKAHLAVTKISAPEGNMALINPLVHKIDVVSEDLVDKTPMERLYTPCVGAPEVVFAVQKELERTDSLASPPADRVVDPEEVEAYRVYRQALRDISKPVEGVVRSPDQQVRDWPTEPKGFDAVSHLRERMEDI